MVTLSPVKLLAMEYASSASYIYFAGSLGTGGCDRCSASHQSWLHDASQWAHDISPICTTRNNPQCVGKLRPVPLMRNDHIYPCCGQCHYSDAQTWMWYSGHVFMVRNTHIKELLQDWFRYFECLLRLQALNPCCLTVSWTHRNKRQWSLNQNKNYFHLRKSICHCRQPFFRGLRMLAKIQELLAFVKPASLWRSYPTCSNTNQRILVKVLSSECMGSPSKFLCSSAVSVWRHPRGTSVGVLVLQGTGIGRGPYLCHTWYSVYWWNLLIPDQLIQFLLFMDKINSLQH